MDRPGLDRKRCLWGRLDKFEIWSPKRLRASTAQDKLLAASIAEEIDL